MRRVINTFPITNKIRNFIDNNAEIPFVKTVGVGDLSILPPPQNFKDWMPAILVCPETIYNSRPANKKISTGEYNFIIRYIKYYDRSDFANVQAEAIQEADTIANILMNDEDMMDANRVNDPYSYRYTIFDNDNKPLGFIIQTHVSNIEFNTIDSEIFRRLNVPVVIVEMQYEVTFYSITK